MYNKIKFIKSIYKQSKIYNKKIEISFIGRSNSGKSSTINAITNKYISIKSKTPGKTTAINYFKIKNFYYFTDTPGYGYANLSKQNLINIKNLLKEYIKLRKNLSGLILLIDSRNPFKQIDYEIIKLITLKKIHILLTKSEKLSLKKKQNIVNNIKKNLKIFNIKNITYQFFSIKNKLYINKLKIKIKQLIYL
jgi:GTP-binding protein